MHGNFRPRKIEPIGKVKEKPPIEQAELLLSLDLTDQLVNGPYGEKIRDSIRTGSFDYSQLDNRRHAQTIEIYLDGHDDLIEIFEAEYFKRHIIKSE